jgi:histidinol-phosphate aminotransferase
MQTRRFKRLSPYVPGEQPRDRTYLKLNTNENPYPPTPRIAEFFDAFDPETLRRYPDPVQRDLRNAVAAHHRLAPENVFVGNGSDEVLSFIFFAFFESTAGPLRFPEHTYSFYPVYCDFYDIDYAREPLNEWTVDIDAFLRQAENTCGVIFPNPNAPTGTTVSGADIRRLLTLFPKNRAVVIDEAYAAFGAESVASLIDEFENLIVVHTFSKSHALAGLRLGYALGSPAVIRTLFAVKDAFNPYPVDTIALKLGEIAITDAAYYADINRRVASAREWLSEGLKIRGWRVLPSRANFVFAACPGVTGNEVYKRLKERGVLVRFFDVPGIQEFVRITVGKPEEMKHLLERIEEAPVFGRVKCWRLSATPSGNGDDSP